MNSGKPTLFVGDITNTDYLQSFSQQIRAIAPHAHIVTVEDSKTDPSLIGRIEIVFGHLEPSLFPRAHCLKCLHTTGAEME